jgi:hypothetical protein
VSDEEAYIDWHMLHVLYVLYYAYYPFSSIPFLVWLSAHSVEIIRTVILPIFLPLVCPRTNSRRSDLILLCNFFLNIIREGIT